MWRRFCVLWTRRWRLEGEVEAYLVLAATGPMGAVSDEAALADARSFVQ